MRPKAKRKEDEEYVRARNVGIVGFVLLAVVILPIAKSCADSNAEVDKYFHPTVEQEAAQPAQSAQSAPMSDDDTDRANGWIIGTTRRQKALDAGLKLSKADQAAYNKQRKIDDAQDAKNIKENADAWNDMAKAGTTDYQKAEALKEWQKEHGNN